MNYKRHILFIIISISINSYGQFGSATVIDSAFSISIRNIIAADIDNDGKKDVITSSFFNEVKWYKNLGVNFSSSQNITSTFPNPYHIDVADADGNGFVDLLLTNNNGNNSSVSVFFNLGGSSWLASTIDTGIVIGAFKSFFFDIENDGDFDVITNSDTKITLYKNNGSGIFTLPIIIANSSEYYSITVNDFTNDGFKDFIVHAGSETLLYVNDAVGGFGNPHILLLDGL